MYAGWVLTFRSLWDAMLGPYIYDVAPEYSVVELTKDYANV